MSRMAIKNTYGVEVVGGVEVKRLIVAGQKVPASIQAPPGTFADDEPAAVDAATQQVSGAGDAGTGDAGAGDAGDGASSSSDAASGGDASGTSDADASGGSAQTTTRGKRGRSR